jgi:hypothetical protein
MASCHLALKNYHKAKVILRLAKHFSEKFVKDDTKFAQKIHKLSVTIQKAVDDEKVGNQVPTKSTTTQNPNNFQPGKRYSSASEKLDIKYAPGVGRFAYATKKIEVGEKVLREQPYATCLSTDKMGTFCLHCFARLKAPVSCDTCSNVAFCSRQCKKDAECYHRYECRVMALLLGSGMSLNCYLALRIVTQGSADEFKKV